MHAGCLGPLLCLTLLQRNLTHDSHDLCLSGTCCSQEGPQSREPWLLRAGGPFPWGCWSQCTCPAHTPHCPRAWRCLPSQLCPGFSLLDVGRRSQAAPLEGAPGIPAQGWLGAEPLPLGLPPSFPGNLPCPYRPLSFFPWWPPKPLTPFANCGRADPAWPCVFHRGSWCPGRATVPCYMRESPQPRAGLVALRDRWMTVWPPLSLRTGIIDGRQQVPKEGLSWVPASAHDLYPLLVQAI